jgi:hypothetical protein
MELKTLGGKYDTILIGYKTELLKATLNGVFLSSHLLSKKSPWCGSVYQGLKPDRPTRTEFLRLPFTYGKR